MRSRNETQATTQSWIPVACGHQDNEPPDRAPAFEESGGNSTLRPEGCARASSRSFPDYEQRLPRALFHEEVTMKSRSRPSCATRSYRVFCRLAPLRNISEEGH